MPKKRRLTDLYRRGKLVTFDDGEGEPIQVWLQKPNRVEMEAIYRRSNAAKARFQLRAADEDSDEFQAALAAVRDVEDADLLMGLALAEELGRIRARIEAQLETDPDGEWAKDDKLQSLYDAWQGDPENPGLRDAYALDPEGETPEGVEAKRVLDEMTKFQQQLDDLFMAERDALYRDWADADRDDLVRLAARTFIENEANDAFLAEFQRQQIFYAVRDPDERDKRYFGTIDEIGLLNDELLEKLREYINEFMVDVSEGKGSAATTDSSPQSEQDEKVDPSQPSGQEESAA